MSVIFLLHISVIIFAIGPRASKIDLLGTLLKIAYEMMIQKLAPIIEPVKKFVFGSKPERNIT